MPCFAIPVDHSLCKTGISPQERALTIQMLVDPSTRPADLLRPGHIFPVIAREGGVLERPGHTEATVDLMRAAGLGVAGVLCEICSRDGKHMATGSELLEIAEAFHMPVITIDDVIKFRQAGQADRLLEVLPPSKTGGAAETELGCVRWLREVSQSEGQKSRV
jgi:3,4-dihydroxy 2-butanone 4-phosphate synthase/GTP cyclohydrolase II